MSNKGLMVSVAPPPPPGKLVNEEPSPTNLVAVTNPVKYAFPSTVNFDIKFVVPMPTFPVDGLKVSSDDDIFAVVTIPEVDSLKIIYFTLFVVESSMRVIPPSLLP